ncbi:hypothetical protein Rhopal_005816-T1 [Rhodotorula paludigena]|uniref:Uncharacterized protein n=1 Tax=Rhodotorula paludigena TaxID=86838 RepID=A0AAV5GRE6_9BASI|nr:hypothetical protein Rhopal_005816-T1 [Rhodotorula paludigena]
MVGLVQCPKLAQSIRDKSRVLAGLKLRPESYRAAPSGSAPTPVAPSAASTTFSSTPTQPKALAHTKEGEALQKTPYLPQGRAAANAQESKTGEADDGRTLNVLSLAGQDPLLVAQRSEATPLGRIGGVEEIKGAAALLASDASQFTTSTNLVVDGGFSLV